MIREEEGDTKTTATSAALVLSNNNHSDTDSEDNESSEEDNTCFGGGGRQQESVGRRDAGRTTTKVKESVPSTGSFFPESSDYDLKGKPTSKEKKITAKRTSTEFTTNLSDRKPTGTSSSSSSLPPNPLTSILSSSELLDFVTEPLSPSQVFQCTIMRDKRGIDRSLYPTYFMYLQTIVKTTDEEMNEAQDQEEDRDDDKSDRLSGKEAGRSVKDKQLKQNSSKASVWSSSSSSGSRQAFLVCGRRRKKSKTYLIGLDPFDISRANSVAKLKSNIIGTEFRSFRSVFFYFSL